MFRSTFLTLVVASGAVVLATSLVPAGHGGRSRRSAGRSTRRPGGPESAGAAGRVAPAVVRFAVQCARACGWFGHTRSAGRLFASGSARGGARDR